METVQFKLSLDSLGEIYQLNHWKELNLSRQPLSLLTSAQIGKRIVSSFKGGLDHLPPKFEHIFVAVITFFPLSSVQILLLPACCLLCVL